MAESARSWTFILDLLEWVQGDDSVEDDERPILDELCERLRYGLDQEP